MFSTTTPFPLRISRHYSTSQKHLPLANSRINEDWKCSEPVLGPVLLMYFGLLFLGRREGGEGSLREYEDEDGVEDEDEEEF